jgi:hypothetical protein
VLSRYASAVTFGALIALANCSPKPAVRSQRGAEDTSAATQRAASAEHALLQGPGRIADSLLTMNGVGLGDNPTQVKRLLGPPLAQDTSDSRETLGYLFITWRYPALELEFADTSVAYITCLSGPCTLSHEVSLGMARSAVERVLGPPLASDSSSPLPPNTVKYTGRASDCGVTLEYIDARLSHIKLWCDYS